MAVKQSSGGNGTVWEQFVPQQGTAAACIKGGSCSSLLSVPIAPSTVLCGCRGRKDHQPGGRMHCHLAFRWLLVLQETEGEPGEVLTPLSGGTEVIKGKVLHAHLAFTVKIPEFL